MSENLSQEEIDELVDDGRNPEKNSEENSISKEMRISDNFSKKLELLHDFFKLTLACFNSLIAKGNIYLAEKKFCESKKHMKEIEKEIEKWGYKVDSFIEKVKDERAAGNIVVEIKEEFKEIATNETDDGNPELKAILGKIAAFEKDVNENLIHAVDEYITECEKNFLETRNEAWNRIYDALIVQRDLILAAIITFSGLGLGVFEMAKELIGGE